MVYREIETDGEMAMFVKCFWMSDSQNDEGIHTVLPDGYFDLIFNRLDNKLDRIFLTGTRTIPVDVPFTKNTSHFGIRFKLIASEYIFRESIERIIDTSTNLPLHYWNVSDETFENLETFSIEMGKIIERFIPDYTEIDRRKFLLMGYLYDNHGDISVAELSERVGWSSRQINRWFNNQFGLPLKTFANILKCHHAYRQIAQGRFIPESAYYDQAHFIKEIKRYTGYTPKELFELKNDRFLQLSTHDNG